MTGRWSFVRTFKSLGGLTKFPESFLSAYSKRVSALGVEPKFAHSTACFTVAHLDNLLTIISKCA
jgi:hypothetical protein